MNFRKIILSQNNIFVNTLVEVSSLSQDKNRAVRELVLLRRFGNCRLQPAELLKRKKSCTNAVGAGHFS